MNTNTAQNHATSLPATGPGGMDLHGASPWVPLCHIYRGSLLELTHFGSLVVVDGDGEVLGQWGNVRQSLWSRSLLKPWQLMSQLPTVLEHGVSLSPQATALMMGSHNGEPQHLKLVKDLLTQHGLTVEDLQCPASFPMGGAARQAYIETHPDTAPIAHPCSGKHTAYLVARALSKHPLAPYLNPEEPEYTALTELIASLLRLGPFHLEKDAIAYGKDGCGMPNLALTPCQMAYLFQQLALSTPPATQPPVEPRAWQTIYEGWSQAPEFMGGEGRLDTELMAHGQTMAIPLVAKEGADGLLGVGIAPNSRVPNGLGILLKLAGGYDPATMRLIITHLLQGMELPILPMTAAEPHIRRMVTVVAPSLSRS